MAEKKKTLATRKRELKEELRTKAFGVNEDVYRECDKRDPDWLLIGSKLNSTYNEKHGENHPEFELFRLAKRAYSTLSTMSELTKSDDDKKKIKTISNRLIAIAIEQCEKMAKSFGK